MNNLTVKQIVVAGVASVFTIIGNAQVNDNAYADMLKRNVNVNGNVNYANLKRSKAELTKYTNDLAENSPTKEWTREAELAYWLNVYNANVLRLILENDPVNSVEDIKGMFTDKHITVGEKSYSLDDVEKTLLKLGGAKMLFGMCKGTYSSPKLSAIPFTEANIDGRIEALAANFINDRSKNQVASSSIKLNEIFKTYAKYFKKEGDLIEFLNQYAMRDLMEDAKISYMKYDWKLNK